MSRSSIHLKLPRLGALFLSFSFAVVGLAAGLNAIVKGEKTKSRLSQKIPLNTATVFVSTSDILDSGIILTVVCGIIAALSCLLFIATLVAPLSHNVAAGRTASPLQSTLLHQAAAFAFLALWLFATIIPFDVFIANDSIRLTATLHGQPIPNSVVAQLAAALGVSLSYRDYDFLVLLAILPWLTGLFTSFAAAVLFVAARQVKPSQPAERQPTLTEKPIDA